MANFQVKIISCLYERLSIIGWWRLHPHSRSWNGPESNDDISKCEEKWENNEFDFDTDPDKEANLREVLKDVEDVEYETFIELLEK